MTLNLSNNDSLYALVIAFGLSGSDSVECWFEVGDYTQDNNCIQLLSQVVMPLVVVVSHSPKTTVPSCTRLSVII